ncbi:MAG: hypothetical protein QOD66_3331 [Solirubrobacteraceae bacterium]|nr:hypothetical protein [Solirubrobacteraceae bacterium]
MLAPDNAVSEFALPAIDARALARRVALPALLGAAALATVALAGGPVHRFAAALQHGLGANGGWLAIGAGFEIVSLLGYVGLLSLVAGRATNRVGLRESAQITLAGAAATRLLPTAGAGGAGLTLWSLRRAGLAPRDAARTLLVFLVVLYSIFLAAIVLAGGALALGLVGNHGPLLLSAIPALAAALCIAVALRVSAGTWPGAARGTSSRVTRSARLLGDAVRDARALVRSGDARLAGAVGYWAFDAAVLWSMLHAFGSTAGLLVVVLAYFVGQVANTLPVPGSVSGGIAGVLIAFGAPAEVALPAVLAYRTIAVWLPTPVAIAAIPGLRSTLARWTHEDAAQTVNPAQAG